MTTEWRMWSHLWSGKEDEIAVVKRGGGDRQVSAYFYGVTKMFGLQSTLLFFFASIGIYKAKNQNAFHHFIAFF